MTDATASVDTGNAATATTTAEAVTQAVETPAVHAQATTSNDWRASLPEDIRDNPSLAKFTSQEALAKSYINAEKMIGSDKIVIPKEGDTDGFRAAMAKLGMPENPDGYGFKQPDKIPDGLQYNADLDNEFAGEMHKAGLTKSQAAAMREWAIGFMSKGGAASLEQQKAAQEAAEKQIEQGTASLKSEWGQAFEQRGKMALKAAEMSFSPETMAALDAAGMTNNPAFIKDLYGLGLKVQGETQLLGAVEMEQSPGDLDAAIAKFQADNMTALMDQAHPDHKRVVAERAKLFEKRWG